MPNFLKFKAGLWVSFLLAALFNGSVFGGIANFQQNLQKFWLDNDSILFFITLSSGKDVGNLTSQDPQGGAGYLGISGLGSAGSLVYLRVAVDRIGSSMSWGCELPKLRLQILPAQNEEARFWLEENLTRTRTLYVNYACRKDSQEPLLAEEFYYRVHEKMGFPTLASRLGYDTSRNALAYFLEDIHEVGRRHAAKAVLIGGEKSTAEFLKSKPEVEAWAVQEMKGCVFLYGEFDERFWPLPRQSFDYAGLKGYPDADSPNPPVPNRSGNLVADPLIAQAMWNMAYILRDSQPSFFLEFDIDSRWLNNTVFFDAVYGSVDRVTKAIPTIGQTLGCVRGVTTNLETYLPLEWIQNLWHSLFAQVPQTQEDILSMSLPLSDLDFDIDSVRANLANRLSLFEQALCCRSLLRELGIEVPAACEAKLTKQET